MKLWSQFAFFLFPELLCLSDQARGVFLWSCLLLCIPGETQLGPHHQTPGPPEALVFLTLAVTNSD